MKKIEHFGLLDLTQEELLMISGGDKASNLLGQYLGYIGAAIEDFFVSIVETCALCDGQIGMHGR